MHLVRVVLDLSELRAAGYRLVYDVVDQQLIVTVIAVGKRERGKVYGSASNRLA